MDREEREQNIELGGDVPKLKKIVEELEQAQTDANWFYRRMEQARSWWYSRWPGQTVDGRKHIAEQGDCFPWDGASDSRLRTVATLIKEEVTVRKFSFFSAKIQAESVRPLQQAGESNKATKLLQWRLYNHMWPQLLREVPLCFNWWQGYGVGMLGIEWDQQRRLDYHEITIPVLAEIMGAMGAGQDAILYLMDAIMDPDREDELTELVQQLSPIISKPQARKIIKDLREVHVARVPVAYPYINQPLWTALRPTIDVLFPSETRDLQAGRWTCRMDDWVSETELTDRIETENYDPEFVTELLKHKGQAGTPDQPRNTESIYGTDWSHSAVPRSYRDLMQVYHFYYKTIMDGVPCLYLTVFNPLCKAKGGDYLYAKHGPAPYDHGQYPLIEFCRRFEDPRILGSIGIAEEAYTDELDIKRQQDGLTDRTSLIHRPPMIVPYSRVKDIKNTPIPGAILGVSRPREVDWMPLPPADATPIATIKMVQERLNRRYPLFGTELDPDLKTLYRSEAGQETLGVMSLALEQTFQLMQQYEVPEEVAAVVGPLARPFPVSREEIQGKHTITATVDMRMLDQEYAANKMALIGQAMAFKQEGLLFRMAIEAIDPDAADAIAQDQVSPAAMEKEKQDELNAIAQAMAGIEPPLPMMANNQLRLQVLAQNTLQSTNPLMAQRLQGAPDAQEILKKRAQFFMNQLQQNTQNPTIGRALATKTFQPKAAPDLTAPPEAVAQQALT